MIDLKNEIEIKLEYAKNLYNHINENDNGYLKSYFLGTIQSYETILKCLENHNIITAPKTIKLSEIVSRLNDSNYRKFEVVKMNTHFLIENTNFYRQYFELKDNKVSNISEEMQIDEFKWLYALWIAGTIVEDDLQEE